MLIHELLEGSTQRTSSCGKQLLILHELLTQRTIGLSCDLASLLLHGLHSCLCLSFHPLAQFRDKSFRSPAIWTSFRAAKLPDPMLFEQNSPPCQGEKGIVQSWAERVGASNPAYRHAVPTCRLIFASSLLSLVLMSQCR